MPLRPSAPATTPKREEALPLLEHGHAALWFHPQSKIVHHEFRRFVHGEDLRSLLTAGLDAFEKHGANKWLSDDRGNGPLKPDDEAWARQHWAPRAIALGWKFWAVVKPEKVFGQTYIQRIIDAYARAGVRSQVFENPTAALRWLKQQ